MQTTLHFDDDADPTQKKPWTVTRLNQEAKSALEERLGSVWVEGEISGLRTHGKTTYFNLKDEKCHVSCVIFGWAASKAPSLSDAMKVEITGDAGLHEARGQYQIVVKRIRPTGAGELEARLRALQEKLRAEGLFDATRKRPLPPHPVRVGVVTSPAGAAIHDFLQILRRRAPHIEVVIAPVRVQGHGAAAEIAAAVTDFSEPARSGFPQVDVVVITRGGGSLEDLWEFNEEVVARAVAACRVPVISAVGHETDFTTVDFAADLRAPTPSAAAELLSADRVETINRLTTSSQRLFRETSMRLKQLRERLENRVATSVFRAPQRRITELQQTLAHLLERGILAAQARLVSLRGEFSRASSVLRAHAPPEKLRLWQERLQTLTQRRDLSVSRSLQHLRQKVGRNTHALELLGPHQTLARGFTITMDVHRRPLTTAAKATGEREWITLFADGEARSQPTEPPREREKDTNG